MEMHKYRFTVFSRDLDRDHIYGLKRGELYDLKKIFNSHNLNYRIKKRTIEGSFRQSNWIGRSYGPTFHKEVEIDWRETIYNLKVQKVKKYEPKKSWYRPRFKISFSVRLTPREAYIIGTELEELFTEVYFKSIQ